MMPLEFHRTGMKNPRYIKEITLNFYKGKSYLECVQERMESNEIHDTRKPPTAGEAKDS